MPIGYSSAGVVTQVGELAPGLPSATAWPVAGAEYANHAEYVYVPATLCARVPDGVGLDEAAFATVGAVALQGVRQSGATVGDRVAVIGLGLLGQITVQLLRAAGCEVAGADLDGARCAAAAAIGAVAATSETGSAAARQLAAATGGVGYDAVIITAGTKSDAPIELAGQIARDRGTVVVVGDVGMHVPRAPFYEKELTLKLSRSYGPGRYDPLYEEMAVDYPLGYVRWTEQRNMAEFLRLVAEGHVDVKPLITPSLRGRRRGRGLRAVTDPASGSLGVSARVPAGRAGAAAHRLAARPPRARPRRRRRRQPPRRRQLRHGDAAAGARRRRSLLPARGLHAFGPERPRRRRAQRLRLLRRVGRRGARRPRRRAPSSSPPGTPHTRRSRSRRSGPARTVFVEKPLAMTETELDEVVTAQRESGGLLTVGFNRRFAPHTRRMVSRLARRSSPANVVIRVNAGADPRDALDPAARRGRRPHRRRAVPLRRPRRLPRRDPADSVSSP